MKVKPETNEKGFVILLLYVHKTSHAKHLANK